MAVPTDSPFFERVRLRGNPVADPSTVVVRGQARFTVLTSRLLRLEWSASGTFEDRATFAFPNRAATPPAFTTDQTGGTLTIDTGDLLLRYRPGDGPFSATNLSIQLKLNGSPVTWTPGAPSSGNLRGTRRTLDGVAGQVTLDEGLISRDGWALYDDSRAVVFAPGGGWVEPRPDRDLQDWYVFGYGHDYTAALYDYTRFGGPIPLIPRYVLGAWWSRYWAYSDQDLKQLVHDFAAHDLPLDVLVLDMDWHTPHSWTGYTWNRELFPDPEGFLDWAHNQGLQVTLNLHPAEGVQSFEEVYPEFAAAVGVDPSTGEAVPFRPGDPRFMRAYFEMLHHPVEEQGVDFWWLDWQQGQSSEIAGLDPLIWLNHLHYLDSARRGRRPMLYSRWGGLGNHRYQIGFSGDTYSIWSALANLPNFTASASNVLYGWWSHDIGGHFGAPSPELYARWVQFGALSPCLRLHSMKSPESERRPWAYPAPVLEASRAAFHLRYRLVPYLYTMARLAFDTGISLCRPLYYSSPEEESAYAARDTYFLGDQVIAAPIISPADPATGVASVDAWLPGGRWFDYQTHETYAGPGWVRLVGGLDRIPMLVREGTILPTARPAPTTSAIPADHLVIEVFPGAEGAFRLYEDDGITPAYTNGEFEWTPMAMSAESGECRLQVGPTEGFCPGLPRARRYEVRLIQTRPPDQVRIDGAPAADWTYDEATRTTVVRVPTHDKNEPVTVAISAHEGILADEEGHKRACILADLDRLLGPACPDAAWEDMPAAVAALDHPARADALARVGGPFVHFFENSVLPEAAGNLGAVVIAGPAGGGPFQVDITWLLESGEGTRQEKAPVAATGDLILPCPFSYTGDAQPTAWEAEVTVHWDASSLTQKHRSATLWPSVPAWEVAIFEPDAEVSSPDAVSGSRERPAAPGWRIYAADPAEQATLTDAFYAYPEEMYEASKDGKRREAYGVATINSPIEQEVRITYSPLGAGGCWLNGQPVAEAPTGTAPTLRILPPLGTESRVSAPVRLQAGENTLLLHLAPPAGAREWEFVMSAALVDPGGDVLTGVRYAAGQPAQE